MSSDESAASGRGTNLQPGVPIVVSVCITCKSGSGETLVNVGAPLFEAVKPALAAQAPNVTVRTVQCLGVCKRPGTVAVSGPDGFTFVFGDLNPQTGPGALAIFTEQYRNADYGFVPWRARPQELRRGLLARIPPTVWSPDDGHPPA